MTKVYLGFGSNEGNRLKNLEGALSLIQKKAKAGSLRVSPIYETPALLLEGAPDTWNRPYLNLVVEAQFDSSPEELLSFLKKIECELGRDSRERWAPRPVDIDILLWGNERFESEKLTIPHPRLHERAFVLDPLKDLSPSLQLSGVSALSMAKRQPQHSPLWMGIINATPDSFSDGGANSNPEALVQKLDDWDAHFVAVIDIGAESTRPGAQLIDTDEEWKRLEPVLKMLIDRYEGRLIRPRLSVDTRYAKTAARALACGIDIINDVSGLQDPGMTDVLRDSSAPYVLMHNLGIPADKKTHLPQQCDPIEELIRWFEEKTALLEKSGIARDRIILDPGIGFGKTGLQSIDILRNLSQLKALPYRLLIGHSRKSFLDPFSSNKAAQRDLESAGVSIHLAADGADILRVHDPVTHIRTFRAWNHLNRSRA